MPTLALADFLKDFGGQQRPAAPAVPAAPRPERQMDVVEASGQPEPDPVASAVEDATRELESRLQAKHAEAIEALKESHKQEIERLQTGMGEQIGTDVAARFEEVERQLVELTSSVVTRILGIALTEDVQVKALEALASAINGAARDREAVRIRIRGPLSLFEALQPMLGHHADRVEFTEAAGFDITAAIDDALFETRLSEWSASLSEIVT